MVKVENTVWLEREELRETPLARLRIYGWVKRGMDILLALAAGILLALPMLLIAALICLDSEGDAIFRQQRVGKDGKAFTIYKFRTMHITAPHDMPSRELAAERYVTRMGIFLRRTSMDELPQLWNVIRGDMSLVGYRPVCLTETEVNRLRAFQGVFALRPGITGLAQVSGRDRLSDEEKVHLDGWYVRHCSLGLDIWCLVRTAAVVLKGDS